MYGYVADSCADKNWWCRRDTYHLDISASHLDSMGLMHGWNGRKLSWSYMTGPPDGCAPPRGPSRPALREPHRCQSITIITHTCMRSARLVAAQYSLLEPGPGLAAQLAPCAVASWPCTAQTRVMMASAQPDSAGLPPAVCSCAACVCAGVPGACVCARVCVCVSTLQRHGSCRYSMGDLGFMFASGSKWIKGGYGFWAALVVYNVPNGIGRVEQKVGDGWTSVDDINWLGQQWSLAEPADYRTASGSGRTFEVRVSDVSGKPYGTYRVDFPCPDGSPCGGNTDTSATRM